MGSPKYKIYPIDKIESPSLNQDEKGLKIHLKIITDKINNALKSPEKAKKAAKVIESLIHSQSNNFFK